MSGDIFLFNTLDGGEIDIKDGKALMTEGLETAVYLSLFSPSSWFCNEAAVDDAEVLYSNTQALINSAPQSTKNYRLLEQAISQDLNWLVTNNYADSVQSSVVSNNHSSIKIEIQITQSNDNQLITLETTWPES